MMLVAAVAARSVRADAFSDYALTGSFSLPAAGVFDVLGDGRLIMLHGADVYTETAVGSRTFSLLGTLPDADMPDPQYAGAAFVRVSPDGTRIAVGNNGGFTWDNYQVGIFNVSDLTGNWFPADHYDAEWCDDRNLALSAGALGPTSVTALDTFSDPLNPTNPVVVTNIGGASAGITFDAAGNLYTGNGFQYGGPSDTGWIKGFEPSEWMPALGGGDPVDFEAEGTLIVDLLSAAALGFDAEGNLHVGGGDFFGGGGDYGYAGLVHHTEVADALGGGGPADPADPAQVRKFDPVGSGSSFYDCNYNGVTGELYFRAGSTVYTYVPEPVSLVLLAAGMMIVMPKRVR